MYSELSLFCCPLSAFYFQLVFRLLIILHIVSLLRYKIK